MTEAEVNSQLEPATREAFRWSRVKAVIACPYLAHALFALRLRVTDAVPIAGVDNRWRLYLNPDGFLDLSTGERCAVLYHEINHLLRSHPARAELLGADQEGAYTRFGVAADLEINDDIDERVLGFALPNGALHPDQFGFQRHLTAEEYFNELADSSACDGAHTCGSGAHGVTTPWEDFSPGDGVTPIEANMIAHRVSTAVKEAPGTVPAGLKRWAEQRTQSVVNWRAVLAQYLRHAATHTSGANDYSYARPSRRAAEMPDVIMPSLRQPAFHTSIIIDTSGSMGPEELATALGEVAGIARAAGAGEVSVVVCDTEVTEVLRHVRANQDVHLSGGGGTDMGVGILAATRLRPSPDIVIVLSDGWTPWPERIRQPLILCQLDGTSPEPPSWVRIVTIDVDDG